MPISYLDLVVLGVVFVSAVLAMMRGLTREVLAIASWVAAAIAAYVFYKPVLPYVQQYVNHPMISLAIAVGAVFIVTLIIVSLITVRISDFILDSRIGALDRTLGFVFGAARGALICIIGFVFFTWLVPADKQPEWVKASKARPYLESSGNSLRAMLPDDPEKMLNEMRDRARNMEQNAVPPTPPASTPPTQQRSSLEKSLEKFAAAQHLTPIAHANGASARL
ncbi:MAG: CvpA family protein [Rhizobiales bacterium]|nr:CvpA family protein [Hyphomicrobiales bacterium]